MAEKKRRDKINLKINELKHLLPSDDTKKSSNKSVILTRTVEFIRQLESHYLSLWEQNQQLLAENRHFKQIKLNLQKAQLLPIEEEFKGLSIPVTSNPSVLLSLPKMERSSMTNSGILSTTMNEISGSLESVGQTGAGLYYPVSTNFSNAVLPTAPCIIWKQQ